MSCLRDKSADLGDRLTDLESALEHARAIVKALECAATVETSTDLDANLSEAYDSMLCLKYELED